MAQNQSIYFCTITDKNYERLHNDEFIVLEFEKSVNEICVNSEIFLESKKGQIHTQVVSKPHSKFLKLKVIK